MLAFSDDEERTRVVVMVICGQDNELKTQIWAEAKDSENLSRMWMAPWRWVSQSFLAGASSVIDETGQFTFPLLTMHLESSAS